MSSIGKSEIESLKNIVKGEVIVKGSATSADYRAAISRWNKVFEKESLVIVYVEDEADVAECIRFVTSHNLDLAVCGGGHALKGTSSSDDFVIDLRKMRRVSVNTTSKTVTAQGGCKMADIENAAYDEGLAIVTGVVNDTGMGISLGAGLGWLSGQYGYMVDNLISATVVLADSSIVTASESQNQDLFWAIRGTGGGFGVISEVTFKAYEQSPVFAGFLIYSPDKVDKVIKLAAELNATTIPQERGKLQLMLSYASPPPNYEPVPLFVLFYNGSETTAREVCAALYDLGPIADTTATIPYPIVNTFFNKKTDMYARHGLSASRLPLPLDKRILKEVWNSYSSTIPAFSECWPSHVVVELRYLAPGLKNSNMDMAFAGRGNWTNILLHPQWNDPAADKDLRRWATDLTGWINSELGVSTKSDGQALVYANYASGDEKSVEIFGLNYLRLRQLKRVYDPGMVFNKWYPITPEDLKN